MRVLVVEDEKKTASFIRKALQDAGFAVDACHNGNDALAAACATLRDAPSDTAAHDALLATLPQFAELQRRLNRALQGDLPHALRRRRQPFAIDLTLTPYHGKPLRDKSELFRSQAHDGRSGITAPIGFGKPARQMRLAAPGGAVEHQRAVAARRSIEHRGDGHRG